MNWIANHLLPLTITVLLANTAVAEVTTVPVEIQSVDARSRKITVRYNGKVATLALIDDAAILLEGEATELNLVIPGDIGNVEFDKSISAVTKLDVRRSEMIPAEKLGEGWEEIDQRLLFLMVRLVDVEANLEAIDKAMGKSSGRAGIATSQAKRAEAGNDRMDRRAGGPVRWDKFYGTTAEKFFYHPTDNHTYHTRTILSHQSPKSDNQAEPGVPSRQGLPVHQRPPQFDYMYRANENAQQRAEANVAKFRGNAAALAARRHELQLEQSKLWCEVAFRAVARNDLDRKALYRFAPSGSGKGDLVAATSFVTTALSIIESGQKDQANTFRQIKPLISKARYELDNKWLKLGVKYRNESTDEWSFAALARRLEDVSANLGDSYTVSMERENAGDSDRRDLYRGLLQKALIQYAETVLALDEMASEMAKAKGFEADLEKPIATTVTKMPSFDTTQGSTEGRSLSMPDPSSRSVADLLPPTDESQFNINEQPGPSGKTVDLLRTPMSESPLVGRWAQQNGWAVAIRGNGELINTNPQGIVDATGKWQDDGNGRYSARLGKQWEWRLILNGKTLQAETFHNGARKSNLTFSRQR